MNVLVIGSGGREHTLVWKLSQSDRVEKIYTAPGNAGTAELGENVAIEAKDIKGLIGFAKKKSIDLTVVGPEAPLTKGIVDRFQESGLRVFGPDQKAAQLEGSKVFSKNLMKKYDIPTAGYNVFTDPEEAISYIEKKGSPIVVKAEGLAAGKGVIVAENVDQAVDAINEIMIKGKFGKAGERIVVEEYLEGEEATVLAFVDGETIKPMVPSQDHKQAYDNDKGPNTGGMGAYAPAPVVDTQLMDKVYQEILKPTVEALKNEGIVYKGVLYCGLMIKDGIPKVLEYNVRFGDPEAQVVLPLLKTDLVEVIEAVLEGRLIDIDIEWLEKKSLCVIMASGGYPIKYEKYKKINGVTQVKKMTDLMVFLAGTAVKEGQLVTAGGRVLAVTAIGDNFQEVIKKAYSGVGNINFEDAHYRSDIGQKAIK